MTRISQKECYCFSMKHWLITQQKWALVPSPPQWSWQCCGQSELLQSLGAVTDWSGGTADFQHSLDEIIKAICGRPWYAVIHNEIWKKTELTWILIWTKYIFEFNADVLETHFCSSEISYPYNTFSDISILSGNHGWSPFCFTHRDCKINLICFFIQFKA